MPFRAGTERPTLAQGFHWFPMNKVKNSADEAVAMIPGGAMDLVVGAKKVIVAMLHPDYTVEQVQEATEARLVISPDLRLMV